MPRYRVQPHVRGISLLHSKFYIYDFTFFLVRFLHQLKCMAPVAGAVAVSAP